MLDSIITWSLQHRVYVILASFILAAAGEHTASKGRFVVVGTSGFAANQFLRIRQVGNNDLYMNMVNWLTSDEDLISIRPKEPEDRRLNITGNGLRVLFLSSLIVLPLLVIGAGFSTWFKRR